VGDLSAEGEVLNTLGMAQIALGDVDQGVEKLRRAQELARETDDTDDLAYVYVNLADMLGLAGRTAEALATAKEGLTAIPSRSSRSRDHLILTASDLLFEAGDWDAAREYLSLLATQLQGRQLIYRQLREAELALGEGELQVAGRCLREIEQLVARSSEPQWHGPFGALLAELRRREHDLDGARTAIAEALDRLELCTDDVARIAAVSAVGVRVEADLAQRGRDLREQQEERSALARARIHVQRLRAAAQAGGPVEKAYLAVGAAELARARGRNDPALWRKAAAKWEEIGRPYPAAIARWRVAEANVEGGDRAAAAEAAGASLETARRLGARWLAEEVGALCVRARLELAEDGRSAGNGAVSEVGAADPFGLTPRERQVLALIAEGATNRQIGSALYMAEKTASVHVSRILGKLGVRSRTQAAAVAHRLHLS
jgi:DNA-binding CsgD family transcriptional regulator